MVATLLHAGVTVSEWRSRWSVGGIETWLARISQTDDAVNDRPARGESVAS